MALILSTMQCTPSVFTAPKPVKTVFGIRDNEGDALAEVTYTAEPPMLIDGQSTVDGGQHAVSTEEQILSRTLTVSGPPGSYELAVSAKKVGSSDPPVSRSRMLTLQ